MTHDKLVEKAANFLKYKKNCNPVLEDHYAATVGGEIPDVIGWKSGVSYLVECQTSRADFFRDKHKKFRGWAESNHPSHTQYGMGWYRYFFVPKNLIEPKEIPDNWGLVFLDGRSYNEIITCDMDSWKNPNVINKDENGRVNESTTASLKNEIRMLTSALRKQST